MKPGDLARLRDVGIQSGRVVTVLKVMYRFSDDGKWALVDYFRDGEIVEGVHSDFLEVIECE